MIIKPSAYRSDQSYESRTLVTKLAMLDCSVIDCRKFVDYIMVVAVADTKVRLAFIILFVCLYCTHSDSIFLQHVFCVAAYTLQSYRDAEEPSTVVCASCNSENSCCK